MDGISYIVGTWKSISLSLPPHHSITNCIFEANYQTEPDEQKHKQPSALIKKACAHTHIIDASNIIVMHQLVLLLAHLSPRVRMLISQQVLKTYDIQIINFQTM